MKVVRLQQGSPEWRSWRRTGLGASDAASVLGLSPWTPARLLWERLTGRAPEQEETFAMKRGMRLEPTIRRMAQACLGMPLPPACGHHDRFSWLLASFDGLSVDGDVILEVKAPNQEAHALALEGKVPDHYRPQVQQQLLVSGAARCIYASWTDHRRFGPHEKLALVEVLPSAEYHAALLYALVCFSAAVALDHWPAGGAWLPAALPDTIERTWRFPGDDSNALPPEGGAPVPTSLARL